MLRKGFETLEICRQIVNVSGKRYNIRPDLDENEAPDIPGYVYPETMAGLFRAMRLNEFHLGITRAVNEMRVLEKKQIYKKTGLNEEDSLYLEECVNFGLLCENVIQFRNGLNLVLYLVDTGGIFALKESNVQYSELAYTSTIDERLKIYRKNIYLLNRKVSEDEEIEFVEDMAELDSVSDFKALSPGTVFLLDLKFLKIIQGMEEQVIRLLKDIKAKHPTAVFYDLGEKEFIDLG